MNLNDNRAVDSIVEAMMRENLGLSQVILSKKYLDFLDIFDKVWADVLLQHSQHNLAIELKIDKQLFFGLIYNFSRPELDVLYEYINKMLAKKFITPFKSFLRASMLFTNKKDGDLCFYIN